MCVCVRESASRRLELCEKWEEESDREREKDAGTERQREVGGKGKKEARVSLGEELVERDREGHKWRQRQRQKQTAGRETTER
jgi:hypothetical protein